MACSRSSSNKTVSYRTLSCMRWPHSSSSNNNPIVKAEPAAEQQQQPPHTKTTTQTPVPAPPQSGTFQSFIEQTAPGSRKRRIPDETDVDITAKNLSTLAHYRASALARNAAFRELYERLVPHVLSAEDFWSTRNDILEAEQAHISNQQPGHPSNPAEFGALPKGADGTITLDAQAIQNIFALHPIIERKYRELVPYTLSEQQFWNKVVQSHILGGTARGRDDLFWNAGEEETEDSALLLKRHGTPLLPFDDLRTNDQLPKGYGIFSSDGVGAKGTTIFKRFNRSGGSIVERMVKSSEPAQIASHLLERQHDALVLPDLQGRAPDTLQFLNLKEQNRYFQHTNEILESSRATKSDQTEALEYFRSGLEQWSFSLARGNEVPHETAHEVLGQITGNHRSVDTTRNGSDRTERASSKYVKVQQLFRDTAEILRHFWGCFPITTTERSNKVDKLLDRLRRLQFECTSFRDGLRPEKRSRYRHIDQILKSIELALARSSGLKRPKFVQHSRNGVGKT
eukprot:c14177_g1_i1.p1 GENE.c14177_g1_i1~~c14177_g1_i1.p1  ORF type:complete len:513 (+),score=94.58 c14177_g1_i1:198-1736(+)